MAELPEHKTLCQKILNFFHDIDGITGAFISGSGATGNMDFYSDLDLGFVCSDEATKEKIWALRFQWDLPIWFHRMDADHVKPYFIIYLFEPHIHVDLSFYTVSNLPSQAGGPFIVAWDKNRSLNGWLENVNQPIQRVVDWAEVVHEEERFWTWIHYAWCHAGRGEYYDVASQFEFLRNIPQLWHARLQGIGVFDSRRLEKRGHADFIDIMRMSFPSPDHKSIKAALLNLIDVHNVQKIQVEKILNPNWTTKQKARDKITRLVSEL